MKLKEICSWLDAEIPLAFQESYDNSGLQVGQPDMTVTSALLTVDVTEQIVEEAAGKGCNLIISHHPLIFSGLKSITGKNFSEKIIYRCIQENIAVYSAHTNLDSTNSGVSRILARKLGLHDIKVLSPLNGKLLKLVTYIPQSHAENVRQAIFNAGAGVIGNYDQCGFTTAGTGSFRGNEESTPFTGEKGKMHLENEIRFETVLYRHQKTNVVNALLQTHPYEEVAYDLFPLENNNIQAGLGCTGYLDKPLEEKLFLDLVKKSLDAKGLRYSGFSGKTVKKVAVCGGSGSSLLPIAISSGADVFVTADIRYHSFFEAVGCILLVDAGHHETEKFATEILKDLLIKKFPKFALLFSETNTNPINYL